MPWLPVDVGTILLPDMHTVFQNKKKKKMKLKGRTGMARQVHRAGKERAESN